MATPRAARPRPRRRRRPPTQSRRRTVKEKPKTDTEQLEHAAVRTRLGAGEGRHRGLPRDLDRAQARKDKGPIARAKALPINDVKLTAAGTEVSGNKATMRVEMRYGFDNIDTAYFKTSRMSAEKTPKGWRISNDRPSAGTLAPWEYTSYKARKSPHFLALAPKSLKVGSLMTDLEKGYNRMKRGLPGVKAPKKVLVIVARTGTDTKALTKDIKTLKSLTAVAENQYSTEGAAKRIDQTWGQRVFVLWRSYGNRSENERRTVITHELVHVALANRTSARTPPWLSEGIAMYVSGDDRSGDAGALISGRGVLKDASKQGAAENAMSLTRLSKPRALDNMSPVSLSFAYSYSSAAAFAIAEKKAARACCGCSARSTARRSRAAAASRPTARSSAR